MFGFLRNKDSQKTPTPTPEQAPEAPALDIEPATDGPEPPKGLFARLKDRLARTRTSLTEGIANLVLGKKAIDEEVLEELESRLLLADVGVEATRAIISDLTARVARKQLDDAPALFAALRENLKGILAPCSRPLEITAARPFIILMVGVNGAGKTTTIGKLAKRMQSQGQRVMLAAGDTFRAAAVEQLQAWGERNDVPVVAQARAADPAAVVFDALQSARARGADVLIADTAGRLHTQSNLMEELKKVKRVLAKLDASAPHEVLLILDASIGQNALAQAEQFHKAVGVTGLVITKLDGTAKGGIVFAIAQKLALPIRYIGVGEGIDDLRVFDADEFVDALLTTGE